MSYESIILYKPNLCFCLGIGLSSLCFTRLNPLKHREYRGNICSYLMVEINMTVDMNVLDRRRNLQIPTNVANTNRALYQI